MKNLTTKHINSPEGVTALMESMWLRHQLGMPQHPNNVFYVELPPLTDEEKTKYGCNHQITPEDEDDEIYYCPI